MMSQKIVRTVVVGMLLALASCGGGKDAASESAAPGVSVDAPEKYDANGCVAPAGGIEPGQLCVRSLSATVKDLDGASVASLITTACGDGCSFGKTDQAGTTRMDVRRYMRKAALMLHGRSRWASYYSRFDATGDVDKGQLFLPKMPFDQGVDLPASGEAKAVTFGDVTYTFAAGSEIKVDQLELESAEEQRFRAVAVPVDKAPPFVAEAGGGFAAVYALTPFATRITPGASVTLANTAKLAAGAAVELFIQGTALDDSYGAFGAFSKVADGHVSADGATIRTDDGQSVPQITWLGVRLKK
jgi:hypothetical protein